MHPKIILIHPPLTKPTEPPAGIAKLSSCLNANGIEHSVIDANLEGILYLLKDTSSKNKSTDRWTARACKNRESNLAALQDVTTYQNISRYRRVVADTNHLLNVAGTGNEGKLVVRVWQYEKRRKRRKVAITRYTKR